MREAEEPHEMTTADKMTFTRNKGRKRGIEKSTEGQAGILGD